MSSVIEWLLRLQRGLARPSFGVGRRAESLYPPEELRLVQIDARLDAVELHRAAWRACESIVTIMGEIVPDWRVPAGMDRLLRAKAELTRR